MRRLAMLEGRQYTPVDFIDPQKSLNTPVIHLQKAKQPKENELAVLVGLGRWYLMAWFGNRK